VKYVGVVTRKPRLPETAKLIAALADDERFEAIVIDPLLVDFRFLRHSDMAVVCSGEWDLNLLSHLIVRGTTGAEAETALLVRTLGDERSVDGLSRFTSGKSGKLLTTLRRWRNHVGVDSYVSFNAGIAKQQLADVDGLDDFPILVKPVNGKHGKGVTKLNDLAAAEAFVTNWFVANPRTALLMQPCLPFKREYRVMLMNGKIIGACRKKKYARRFAEDRALGSKFIALEVADLPACVCDALKTCSDRGLLGVDVGVLDNEAYIIEENRSPEWSHMGDALGADVAKLIVDQLN